MDPSVAILNELEADATGISTTREDNTLSQNGEKPRTQKFLKIDKDQFNVINAEVTSNEVKTAVKDLQDKGKKILWR